jgi:alpha-mannosidase
MGSHEGTSLPARGQFLEISGDNLVLSALNRHEDDPDRWILRLYEAHGQPADLAIASPLGIALGDRLNLLEETLVEESISGMTAIAPWQIATYSLKVAMVSKQPLIELAFAKRLE